MKRALPSSLRTLLVGPLFVALSFGCSGGSGGNQNGGGAAGASGHLGAGGAQSGGASQSGGTTSGGAPGNGGTLAGTSGGTTSGALGGSAAGGLSGAPTSGGSGNAGTGTGGAGSGGAANGGNTAGGMMSGGGMNGGSAGATGGGANGGTSSGGAGGRNSGGSAGSTTTGGGNTGSGNTFPLSDDFESYTAGTQPAGWDNFISYVKNNMNPQGDTLALVDTMHAHSGTKAMHFHGGSQPAMITRPLPMGTNKLYVRAYFYMTRQLGMNPGANHETLIGIRKISGMASDEVRFGEIKGVIGTNEVPSDNISPKMDQWGKGPVIAANKWACIEVAFLGDQAQNELDAWADGTLVHSITMGDQWQNGTMPANWLNGKFVEVILGWQSFSSATNDVWMDDLVLSTSPIGCD